MSQHSVVVVSFMVALCANGCGSSQTSNAPPAPVAEETDRPTRSQGDGTAKAKATDQTTLAKGTFTITTTPSLGFKVRSTVCNLGQPMSALVASFGPAERTENDAYEGWNAQKFTQEEYAMHYLAYTKSHCYASDGLIVTEDREGAVKSIVFYVLASESLNCASVKTEEGITSGASFSEIIRVYGEPFKKTESNVLRYQDTQVYYKYGTDVLCFRFKDGVLETISISAEYLPYLK